MPCFCKRSFLIFATALLGLPGEETYSECPGWDSNPGLCVLCGCSHKGVESGGEEEEAGRSLPGSSHPQGVIISP